MKRRFADETLQKCYEKGYDAGKNGANTTNSHFSLFTSPDRTKAWEKGNKRAKEERQVKR